MTDEPIAQDHLQINCIALQTKETIVAIQNRTSSHMTYQIETDLINPQGET